MDMHRTYRSILIGVTVAVLCGTSVAAARQPAYSALWGREGERWDRAGRLSDFSYAGYMMGERPIPTYPAKTNVRQFGAKGDGKTDDTEAFKKAIAATNDGAVLIPAGKYVITDFLTIEKSRVVLRGEGPDKSILYFPKPLTDVKPNWGATTTGERTSNYSWSGGFVYIRGGNRGREVGKIARPAKRGESVIALDKNASLKPGDLIEIRQNDDSEGSLLVHLYNGQTGDISKVRGKSRIHFVSRVVAVGGPEIRLQRALLTNVDPKWKATVRKFEPRTVDVGIEKLCFEFPPTDYKGEFSELGFNPLQMSATNCWATDIKIVNGESGPYVHGDFNTISGIVFESHKKPSKRDYVGHHGISCYGNDNLIEKFDIRTKYVHDLSVERSAGNVFRTGRGADMCFDHHKRGPHANLFTNLDLGEGSRMYRCGGGSALGKNSAAWGTFWGLRAKRSVPLPPKGFGPDLMNYVGVHSRQKQVVEPAGTWWEPVDPVLLRPADLYQAQLDIRLGRVKPKSQKKKAKPRVAALPPPPKATADALAAWDSHLAGRVAAALSASRPVSFHLASFGTSAKVRSVQDGKLNVEVRGLTASVRIGRLSLRERAAISEQLARTGEFDDIALAAFFSLAAGRTNDAESYLARLPDELAGMVRAGFE